MADDLYNLELLSLIARITQEIYNYIAVNDKVLAEYVVNLHEQSSSANDFKVKLNGALPDSAIENIDRLILSLHPKHKKKTKELANILAGSHVDGHGQIETDKQKRLFPGLSLPDQEMSKDVLMQEVDDMMAQFEGAAKKNTRVEKEEESLALPQRKDRSRSRSPPRRRSRSPDRGRSHDTRRDYRHGGKDRVPFDERPVLFKIYNGRISGLKDFGAFVQVEGVSGRVEGKHSLRNVFLCPHFVIGMVHVSNIQQGARANSASDLLSRGQQVKVKVMSVAGNRIGLSMKDVDQVTGRDLTPHLRIKSEAEMEEERERAARASSGANAVPLRSRDEHPVRSAKRLTSPERWEIKQLISSGVIDASEYPDLDEDFNNPVTRAEVEEELDVEIREEEPAFLAGQTKRTLDLSPVKIIKAPDGSLNRAAIGGAALAKERRELRQQEVNERADSEARDFSAPWLDPMAKDSEKVFAQDLRGNLRDQKAGEVPKWRESTFNKATTYGEITSLSIQDQRKSLPIYKLRDPLLQAIGDVILLLRQVKKTLIPIAASGSHRCWRHWVWENDPNGPIPC